MKQFLRVCVLAFCVGAGVSMMAGEAEASPGFGLAPLASPGFGAMFNTAKVASWRTPFAELTKLKFSGELSGLSKLGEFGMLQQNFAVGAGPLIAAFIVLYSIAAIAAIVGLVGNIVAMSRGRGRFGWGITGIICGSVAILLTSFFTFGSVDGLLFFLPVALAATGAIVLGIINLIAGIRARRGGGGRRYYRRRYRRRRYRRRYDSGGFRTEQMFNTATTPMVNISF